MQALDNIMAGRTGHPILPFLWVHGEDAGVLKQKVEQIHASGIRSVCVEARPHKDFNGPKWFEDLETILTACKNLGMEMWLLDDSHFPTGWANGEVKKNHPALRKQFLCLKTLDYTGPVPGSGAVLKYALRSPEDQILGVYLQRRTSFEGFDPSATIDVTGTLHTVADYNTGKPNVDPLGRPMPGIQGEVPVVNFDLPEGDWSLNILTVSYKGGEKQTEGYLNPMVPEATDVLLNTVYQPVYEHFGAEFGKTFRGFFSDEPRFGNIHGAEGASIGRNSAMNLPWRSGMAAMLAQHCAALGGMLAGMTEENLLPLLPLLFCGDSALAHALRYAYMDLVSRLYSEHFDGRIAAWCHAHGCEHIGHTIEDNEAAGRLGYGAGHLFRAMAHADMAGVDVVIQQLMPGMDKGLFKGMHSPGWDGEFFAYLLGKFGGSLAHLDPKKKGRCMCELFGAYGWYEGTRLEKWLVDYMLVRGVNRLVPHAFDCAPFPDSDCPPHFGADGHDPQTAGFRALMSYSTRLCSLLSGGVARPDLALYFNAEGEWSGDYMPTQKPAAVLARAGMDYDLISADFLAEAKAEQGCLVINGMELRALVLPWAEALPGSLLRDVLRLAEGGVPVWFVDGLPARCAKRDGETLLASLAACPAVHTIPLKDLADVLLAAGIPELVPDTPQPYLRRYHYSHPDGEVYFFTNEGPAARIQTVLQGAPAGRAYVYDPFANTVTQAPDAFALDLPPYGSKVVLVPKEPLADALPLEAPFVSDKRMELGRCQVQTASFADLSAWSEPMDLDAPVYVTALPGYESFGGRIRYHFRLTLDAAPQAARLRLSGVREGAAVTVNGHDCGMRICPDYCFRLTGLQAGSNELVVELNTTLGRAMNDFISAFAPLEPAGLTGAVVELQ